MVLKMESNKDRKLPERLDSLGTKFYFEALFDWYDLRNQPRGAGFLVQAIKNPCSISMSQGFQNSWEASAQTANSESGCTLKLVGERFIRQVDRLSFVLQRDRNLIVAPHSIGFRPLHVHLACPLWT